MKRLWLFVFFIKLSIAIAAQQDAAALDLGLEKGIKFIESKDFKAAKRHFKKLSKSFPNELDPAYFEAVADYLICMPWHRKLPKAISTFDKLIEEFPGEAKLYFRRALAKQLALKHADAKKDLEICRQISAVIPETYYYLASADLRRNMDKGPNQALDNARMNFELFLELTDSTHNLHLSAKRQRAIAQLQNNIAGLSQEEMDLITQLGNSVIHEKPLIIFALDTAKQIPCKDLYRDFGVLIPEKFNSKSTLISFRELNSTTKLSEILDIDSVISFKLVTTKISFNASTKSPYAYLLDTFNKGDEFSIHTKTILEDLKAGESIYFEDIQTADGKQESFGFRLSFKIKTE